MTDSGHEHASRPTEPRTKLRVVDVIRSVTFALLCGSRLSFEQRRLLFAIRNCRTPALGGTVLVCPDCGMVKEVYHSCRNRHCPNCQAEAQEKWIEARADAMLAVPHFHVVFTLPAQLRPLYKAYPKAMYALLLRCCGDVLITLGYDTIGAQLGVTTVLHTWTRDLSFHPHVHCIVSAGGWDADAGQFRKLPNGRYLFPQARMKAFFRARFLRGLRGLVQQGAVVLPDGASFSVFEKSLPPKKSWGVHAEPPFRRFHHVLAYLGRYTHRVGISNARLRNVTDSNVTFATRDGKTCTLTHLEFTRRFLMHVLPDGFKKIRHYGLYSSGSKQREFARAAVATTPKKPPTKHEQDSPADADLKNARSVWTERCCSVCKIPLLVAAHFPRPTHPVWWPP